MYLMQSERMRAPKDGKNSPGYANICLIFHIRVYECTKNESLVAPVAVLHCFLCTCNKCSVSAVCRCLSANDKVGQAEQAWCVSVDCHLQRHSVNIDMLFVPINTYRKNIIACLTWQSSTCLFMLTGIPGTLALLYDRVFISIYVGVTVNKS